MERPTERQREGEQMNIVIEASLKTIMLFLLKTKSHVKEKERS